MERAKGKNAISLFAAILLSFAKLNHQPVLDSQVYIEFQSRQAATAAKHYIDESATDGSSSAKKLSVSYWNPGMNPFKTLPKDAPARGKDMTRSTPSVPYNDRGNYGGGFRGRGGFNSNRGNMNQNNSYGNTNSNRTFAHGTMGFNNMGGGFNNPMGAGNFGFNNRGNMMGGGMRGGPGGMRGNRGGANMMGMGPMGAMPMGMPGNMGMMGMGGGMPGKSECSLSLSPPSLDYLLSLVYLPVSPPSRSLQRTTNMEPGFQGMTPNFGGGFGFGQNQGGGGGGGDWGNPHGAKRPRPE